MQLVTLERAFAIADYDRYANSVICRYLNFVRIARGNAVSWRSIGAIGFQLLKQRVSL